MPEKKPFLTYDQQIGKLLRQCFKNVRFTSHALTDQNQQKLSPFNQHFTVIRHHQRFGIIQKYLRPTIVFLITFCC
jgi:hypothetical protein